MAKNAISETGVSPVHLTLRHFMHIKTDVDRVIAIATGSISYILVPPARPHRLKACGYIGYGVLQTILTLLLL